MKNKSEHETIDLSTVLRYVEETLLKGCVEVDEWGFDWQIGEIRLDFCDNIREMTVHYYRKRREIGHFHLDYEDVIPMIETINVRTR